MLTEQKVLMFLSGIFSPKLFFTSWQGKRFPVPQAVSDFSFPQSNEILPSWKCLWIGHETKLREREKEKISCQKFWWSTCCRREVGGKQDLRSLPFSSTFHSVNCFRALMLNPKLRWYKCLNKLVFLVGYNFKFLISSVWLERDG